MRIFFLPQKYGLITTGKTYDSVITSLKKLKTDYLDLVLLHQPLADYYGAYRDLEKLYKEGKVRAIGVSNFYPDRFVDLCLFSEIKPMVNQIEVNVFNQQIEAKKWADKYGTVLEAWAPFGEGRNNMFQNETLKEIASKYYRSIAQVILRWLLQRGIVSLAKSIQKDRIEENFDIYSFALGEDDMNRIASSDTKTSLFFSHQDPAIIEWFGDLILQRRGKQNYPLWESLLLAPLGKDFFLFLENVFSRKENKTYNRNARKRL